MTPESAHSIEPPLTPTRVLQKILALVWVRRYLIIVPLLLGLPLGILLSYVLPRSYVTNTLLLLQETGGILNSRDFVPPQQSQDRFNGLQALLKSDRVLKSVVSEINRDKPELTQKQLTIALADLKEAISLHMLSSEILEVRLRGSRPEGMGKTLETISARLLESLLAPEDIIVTAPQLVVERRKEQLEVAERAFAEFMQNLKALPTQTGIAISGRGAAERLVAMVENQKAARSQIDAIRLELAVETQGPGPIGDNIAEAERRIAELSLRDANTHRVEIALARRKLERLTELQSKEALYVQRQAEIDRLSKDASDEKIAAVTSEDLSARRVRLQEDVKAARQRYDDARRRFGSQRSANKFQILRSPEQITIIDAPKDPEFPQLGRSTIVLLVLAASALIGGGLALAADFADPRLRSSSKLTRLTGAGVWARLPTES